MFDCTCLDKYGDTIYTFTQWDLNQKIYIEDSGFTTPPVFHFCNKNTERAFAVTSVIDSAGVLSVDIPNQLLIEPYTITMYVYVTDGEAGKTVETIQFPVRQKTQPNDFEFIENIHVVNLVELEADVKELIEAVEKEEKARQTNENNRASAEKSRQTAETSRVNAETNRANAETARVSAENARVTAENKRATAESSRATAETARSTSESARVKAESERATAETTRQTNETSRSQSETARVAAETARSTAESTRASNENKRISSESARVKSENARITSESAREAAEDLRSTSESERIESESLRQSNEAVRISNENTRKSAESTRSASETARIASENARVTAETARAKAETDRASEETKRVNNETARGNAETARATAEQARVSAEATRQSNEQTRQTNEQTRQNNTSTAIANADKATTRANTAAKVCEDIVIGAGLIPITEKGSANGIAELDENGKVPSSQLPSFVDDVIEGYYDNGNFYSNSSRSAQIDGEAGKIYVDVNTELTYRWSGSAFIVISSSLALGETSSSAYRGDRGKIAYDHSQSAHAPSNAEANQNAFSKIVAGSTTISSDNKTDTLTLASSNVTLTPDAANKKVTIGITKNNVVAALGYTPPTTDTTYSTATSSTAGLVKIGYTASGQNYPVALNSSGQMYVNVPWTDTNTWRPLGTTADTACAGNDSRLSNSRPASDVYAWAKAATKPSYTWNEITSKPSTFTPSSHNHSDLHATDNSYTASMQGDGNFVVYKNSDNSAIFASKGVLTDANYTSYCAPASHSHTFGSLEFTPSTSAGHGGFIDFHYNGSTADYTSRIIESSSGNLSVSGNMTVGASTAYTTNQLRNMVFTTTDPGAGVSTSHANGSVICVYE